MICHLLLHYISEGCLVCKTQSQAIPHTKGSLPACYNVQIS